MRPLSFIHYLLHAKTRYSVHSPFVYEFCEKVLRGKGKDEWYRPAEATRRRMLGDAQLISFEDYGTGGLRTRNYSMSIKQIARNSGRRKREGRMLARLAAWQKPTHILELGTSLGISTLYFAAACPTATIITLEGCREVLTLAENNFSQAGMKNIRSMAGPFEKTLPRVLSGDFRPNLVLIDGNHDYQPTLEYFHHLLALATPDTVLIFDDIHWSSGMERAWKEICARPEVTLSIDIFSMGLAFFKSGFVKQHFILRF